MTILTVLSSAAGSTSASKQLATAIVHKLLAANSGSTVVERDVVQKPIPALNFATSKAIHDTDENDLNPAQQPAVKLSDELIAELKNADAVVIAMPLYNYGIPSSLKAWIDQICSAGATFYYNSKGQQVGLLENKTAYLAISSGGIYSNGPLTSWDHALPYMKTVLASIGITNVIVHRVEGMGITGIKEKALQKAIEAVRI